MFRHFVCFIVYTGHSNNKIIHAKLLLNKVLYFIHATKNKSRNHIWSWTPPKLCIQFARRKCRYISFSENVAINKPHFSRSEIKIHHSDICITKYLAWIPGDQMPKRYRIVCLGTRPTNLSSQSVNIFSCTLITPYCLFGVANIWIQLDLLCK